MKTSQKPCEEESTKMGVNVERIKKALEEMNTTGVSPTAIRKALALINSQEHRIFELENRLKECENGYEGTNFLDRCKLHDAEENVKKLTEENKMWQEASEHTDFDNRELSGKCDRLIDENNRLRGILLQFTDTVSKWSNKNGYDTSELYLIPILVEEAFKIIKQIQANTVQKMQERLKVHCVDNRYWCELIDQIAKEMLEGG